MVQNTTDKIRTLFDLTKCRITIAVTLTTGVGYLLSARAARWEMVAPLLGVFLLASGASALNQCQEVKIDARMQRTRQRPIPTGRVSPSTAFFIAGILILSGLYALAGAQKNPGVLLGLGTLALAWYNGVYTYLKRVTAFAVVPGALIGSLPPLIGWSAAGGVLSDPLIILTAVFFWIWQIPHFWLLLLMHGDEYAEAGLPTLTRVFSRPQLFRVTFMWLLAAAVAGVAFPSVAHATIAWPWAVAMVGVSLWLAIDAFGFLRPDGRDACKIYRRAFVRINLYALGVMFLLSCSALF